MDPSKRQQLAERIWLLEQLRGDAKLPTGRATTEALRSREAAADAGRQAAELPRRVAELDDELADLLDQIADPAKAAEERADGQAEQREAAARAAFGPRLRPRPR